MERGFDRVGQLPQIDRRRVEICRALALRPRLLLLDEPSAGMSPAETAELMRDLQIVRGEAPELSLVIIEHDMFVIEGVSQRVVAFNYGRKIAEGTFAEVAAHPEVREAYLGKEGGAWVSLARPAGRDRRSRPIRGHARGPGDHDPLRAR